MFEKRGCAAHVVAAAYRCTPHASQLVRLDLGPLAQPLADCRSEKSHCGAAHVVAALRRDVRLTPPCLHALTLSILRNRSVVLDERHYTALLVAAAVIGCR